MNTKLDNITTQYRKFNENQTLTEGQLNEFIDYFEDQDRLSRTRLSGVGIVCGFKSAGSSSQPSITITQGAGVTTDGDLITLRKNIDKSKEVSIKLDSNAYTYYKTFTDKVNYPYFLNNTTQMSLLELFTQEEYAALQLSGTNMNSFLPVSTITQLENKVIILYLESYSNEESPCEDADCDHNGAEQVSELRVLLANKNDVDTYVINGQKKDSIYNLYNSYEELYDRLEDIEVPRVILNKNITTEPGLRAKFHTAIAPVVSDLVVGFSAIAQTFAITIDLSNQTLSSKLGDLLDTNADDDYQYRYDLLKDLVDTYKEIRSLILHLKAVCCPDIVSFPKHLLLGPVGAALSLGEYTPRRHNFYNSPINNDADENQEKLLLLANRFVQKIKNFQTFSGAIKITPSKQNVALGKKAVPFYYSVNRELLKKWDFEKTQTSKETYNLSYHTTNLATADYVQNPLLYNIDDYDFYRIEGHLGMPYKIALQNINDLKSAYGLAFDVVPLVLRKGVTTTTTTTNSIIGTAALASPQAALSVKDLRANLVAISRNVSNQSLDTHATLRNISVLDEKLRLLNGLELATGSEVSLVKQSTKEDDVVAELLSDFLDRNSGLEHVAGVPNGGTFYLIYQDEADNEVIADFAVPYLCCSKKDPVFLVLPATQLCQNDAKIPITIIPLDGEVKAYAGNTQVTGVTVTGGQNYFNPALVSPLYFGQPITFTVNDDPVDTEIKVYGQPGGISVTADNATYGEDDTNPDATVVFNVSGNISNLEFTWNFGDGTPVILKEAATITREHTYSLVAGQQANFSPTLTVTNGNGCSIDVAIAPLALTGQMVAVCLAQMEVIVRYTSDKTLGPPGADHTHSCNFATYELKANDVSLGQVSLNNSGGTAAQGYGIDLHNYPPEAPAGYNGKDRYNKISIDPDQALEISQSSSDGFVTFSLDCVIPPNTSFPATNCHSGVNWTQVLRNGVLLWEGLPADNFFSINPCTGDIKN